MSKSIHPEDGIVISKKWLEDMIGKNKSELEKSRDTYERLELRAEINQLEEVLENSQTLKSVLEEKEEILNAVYEGADNWKQEYDECRKILIDLCALKKEKDSLGKTDHYLEKQPEAWKNAFEFIVKYQHFGE